MNLTKISDKPLLRQFTKTGQSWTWPGDVASYVITKYCYILNLILDKSGSDAMQNQILDYCQFCFQICFKYKIVIYDSTVVLSGISPYYEPSIEIASEDRRHKARDPNRGVVREPAGGDGHILEIRQTARLLRDPRLRLLAKIIPGPLRQEGVRRRRRVRLDG